MSEPLQIGDAAPDFVLRSHLGEMVDLAGVLQRGRSALIVFYPFAFSRICTSELDEIRDDLTTFQNDGVQVLAVSCDPMQSLRAFAEAGSYDYPLLSDFWPHGAVARSYGVLNETVGAALRGSFLVDPTGVIRWRVVNGLGDARSRAAYREALASA